MIAPPKPPRHDDPEALIPEARERQRRRRIIGTAVIATAAGLALGIYALVGGFGQTRTTKAPIGASGVPLCRSSQVSSRVDTPIGPVWDIWLTLRNKSGAACSLPPGAPTVLITWHGTPLPTHEVHRVGIRPADWMPLHTARLLRPGRKAGVTLKWSNWCGRPHSYRPLMTYHVRFSSALQISFEFGPRPACDSPGSPSVVQVSRPLLVRG